MPLSFPVASILDVLQYTFVIAGAIVFVTCVTYLWTTLPELRFRGMWKCPRCEELGPFLGRCSACQQWAPGLMLCARWLLTFFGPIVAVAVIFVVLWLLRYLRPAYLVAFLLGIPFAVLGWVGYALLFGRRMWLCPQCKEPGSFFGRCKICGQPAPGLMHSLGHLGLVLGIFIILAWVWLAIDLFLPYKSGGQQGDASTFTSVDPSHPTAKAGKQKATGSAPAAPAR